MPISSLPVFYDMQYTEKDGTLTTGAFLFNDELWEALNLAIRIINSTVTTDISSATQLNTITLNGLVAPSKTTAQIAALTADASLGTIFFNTDLAKLQVKTAAATIETITSV